MPFLSAQDAAFVRNRLAQELRADVTLEYFASSAGGLIVPGQQDAEIAEYTRQILAEVANLSPKITLRVHSAVTDTAAVERFAIRRTPATAVVGAQDYGIRYYGVPAGYEFATLLDLIVAVSQGQTPLADRSRQVLSRLANDVHIQVFVTPT